MSPVPGATRPYPPPPGVRRATDRYMAIGFFGIHVSVTIIALDLAFLQEPYRSWHPYVGAALFLAGLLPLYAAAGIWRLILRARAAWRDERPDSEGPRHAA